MGLFIKSIKVIYLPDSDLVKILQHNKTIFLCDNFKKNFPEMNGLTNDQICANIKKIFKIGS